MSANHVQGMEAGDLVTMKRNGGHVVPTAQATAFLFVLDEAIFAKPRAVAKDQA